MSMPEPFRPLGTTHTNPLNLCSYALDQFPDFVETYYSPPHSGPSPTNPSYQHPAHQLMDDPPITSTSGSKLRDRSIWFHLHFWIGWIAAIPIALVCLTGAILIFEGELIRWENQEYFQLEENGNPLTTQQVLDTYRSSDPPLQVNHLGIPKASSHAYSAYVTEIQPDGSRRGGKVYLNQFTGELTWAGDKFTISGLIIDVHRHLAAGKIGQQIIGVSSLVLAVTCIIGLVLWWPLRGRTFIRAWKRGQALDWHNALGLVAMVPLIVMAITGISFTWGKHVWPFLEGIQGRPSQTVMPAITVAEGNEKISVDVIIDQIRAEFPGKRITGIQPGSGKQTPVKAFLDADGNNLQFVMDPYTGEELLRIDGTGNGPVGWYRKNFGKFHTFGPYHITLRILWGLISLGGTILAFTGLWISIKRWRRPKRRAT